MSAKDSESLWVQEKIAAAEERLWNARLEAALDQHEAKVAAVSRWAVPRDLASVRSLLGFAAFFSAHVPHLATMAAPLHLLKRKGQPWVWGPEQQEAFERIKEALTTAPVLKAPRFGVTAPRFALEVDAVQCQQRRVGVRLDTGGCERADCGCVDSVNSLIVCVRMQRLCVSACVACVEQCYFLQLDPHQ